MLDGFRVSFGQTSSLIALGGDGRNAVQREDGTCALAVGRLFSQFLSVESCGQCPPCKLQSGEITDALARYGLRLHAKVNVQNTSGEYLVWYGLFTRGASDSTGVSEASVGVVTR